MMEAYSHEKHYDKLRRWLRRRDIVVPPKEHLSRLGYCMDGIAIGFLLVTSAKQAFIDHIAADPDTTKIDRDSALVKLIRALEIDAFTIGMEVVTTLTQNPSMKSRLQDLGFNSMGEYSLYFKRRSLTGE